MSVHETFARGSVIDGRFRIVRLLATGERGDVYVAEQLSLSRTVALKVLSGEARLTSAAMDRFRREAQLLSTVDHPSVARVLDFGQTAGAMFLVSDLVDGETLAERLEQVGSLPVGGAAPILRQIAEGLAAIHERGIVHRDLKPENVVVVSTLGGDRARLLDFGIALLLNPAHRGDGNVAMVPAIAQPEYAAPEVVAGGAADARADVYAFGVLAYRMLTGRMPGDVDREPTTVRFQSGTGADDLAALVMRCLARDPTQRPADGTGLCSALAAVHAAGPLARPESGASAGTPSPHAALLLAVGAPSPAGEDSDALASILTPLIRDHRGRVAQRRRDRVLASFRSPTDAVRCGIALQDALAGRLVARVAVHIGEVPTGAAILASIAERADPGEVVLTGAVRLSMNRAGVALEPVAAVPLAGGGRLPVYRCVRSGEGAPRHPGARALGSVWRGALATARRLKRLAWR